MPERNNANSPIKTDEEVLVLHDGPITRITLNRPWAMNALTDEMHIRLNAVFDDFATSSSQRVAVITGAGERAFCAGSDLKQGVSSSYPSGGYAGLARRFDLAKPVIAAVNGVALGGGFELALACDLIIASDTARFGLPEPLVGAVALGGGLHRLPRQIGMKQAMGLILTSRGASAEEGYRLGFVNEVVGLAALGAVVDGYCADILKGAPLAIAASKVTAQQGMSEGSLEAALKAQESYREFEDWRNSEDAIEGVSAFVEKRAPKWRGT